ncbi:MAG: helix-turn-helix domain-containing protein [Cytophagales bacterium]|jgi:transcriptional regulator with XRE-family HTH domain|nr:helix-turn-helix domain-containing protein [Cytophagales bacterium]
MKFKEKYDIAPEFENLFAFKNKEEELEHEAKMIMFRFLSELDKLFAEKPILKKELAKAINTSASFITQLYQGDKLINLLTLAKIQEAYNLTFEIKAKLNSENYKEEIEQSYHNFKSPNSWIDENGYWVYVSKNPDYKSGNIAPVKKKSALKVA